jgi:type III pantothenate kinase
MLLLIDIGNTNIVLGLSDGEKVLEQWRIRTERGMTSDELGALVRTLFAYTGADTGEVKRVTICSVVPPLMKTMEAFCLRYFHVKPIVVGPDIHLGMPIVYDNPREVGPDRIVNSVAAYEKFGTSLVVVDLGTATTFDCVSKEGAFLGGAIAPGILTSCASLFEKASRLPMVEIFAKPKTALAKNTLDSMNVGIVCGYAGLVDGIVRRIKRELGEDSKVIATGGLAPLISSEAETIDHVEEQLTLEGLIILSKRNL